jgi:hypothetical protein
MTFINGRSFPDVVLSDPVSGLPIDPSSPNPSGTTQVNASSGNVANAAAVAALPAVAAKTNYLSGFEISGSGATAGLPVTVTVAGILGGTQSFTYTFAAGVLVGNQPLVMSFFPPLQASAVNTAITVTCPAGGAGNTNNVANAHGYVK